MIISHEHKFIFFAVGKTGTHSVESVLKKYADNFEMSEEERRLFQEHIPPYYLRERLTEKIWSSYFKFGFVRNPWDVVVSSLVFNRLVDRNIEFISVEDVNNLFEFQKKFRRGIDWCESRQQHAFLADREGKLLVDYVGRFEKLQQDFSDICRTIGIPPEPLPVRNARKHRPYQQYYTPETIEAVRQLWRRDIEAFEYEFDHAPIASRISENKGEIGNNVLPIRCRDFSVRRIKSGFLLRNRETKSRIWLNASGYHVWRLCDGVRNVGDISRKLSNKFSAPATVIAQDVQSAVRAMHLAGLLSLDE